MSGWIVLLVPLVLLPIVLLLAFVGCGLPTSGTGPDHLYLQIGPGSFANVQQVEVGFKVVAGSQNETSFPQVLSHDHLTTDDFVEYFSELLRQPADVMCTCTCTITLVQPGAPVVKALTSPEGSGPFRLSGEEFGFPMDNIHIKLGGGIP